MILDTSAAVAIVMKEPGYEELLRMLAGGTALIGTATLTEMATVLSARLQSKATRDPCWLDSCPKLQ